MMSEYKEIDRALGSRYSITGVIGSGTMGIVYSALDNSLSRKVAVKVIHEENEQVKKRFRKEIKVLGGLQHKNIIPLLDSGESGNIIFYITPLNEGQTLMEALEQNKRLRVSDALSVAMAVAAALEESHQHGVIHRDLKPSNILVPSNRYGLQYSQSLVTDFSVVGALGAETGQTQAGQIYGTPRYMSPEQISGAAQSSATDVYGLGLLLYEMIFGVGPFKGEDAFALMQEILTQDVEIPEFPSIPQPLKQFIRSCLKKEPEGRPVAPYAELSRLVSSLWTEDEDRTVIQPSKSLGQKDIDISVGGSKKSSLVTKKIIAVVTGSVALIVLSWLGLSVLYSFMDQQTVLGIAVGILLIAGGVICGYLIRKWLLERQDDIKHDAAQVLFGARDRNELGDTLAIELDELIAKCRSTDEKFLGQTVALMIDEYRNATSFSDRKAALVTAVQFLEKLTARMTPWYIKYEKLIVALVSILGLIAGVIKIFETIS